MTVSQRRQHCRCQELEPTTLPRVAGALALSQHRQQGWRSGGIPWPTCRAKPAVEQQGHRRWQCPRDRRHGDLRGSMGNPATKHMPHATCTGPEQIDQNTSEHTSQPAMDSMTGTSERTHTAVPKVAMDRRIPETMLTAMHDGQTSRGMRK